MKKKITKKKIKNLPLLIAIGVIPLILIPIILFLPLLFIKPAIANFYQENNETTFISNNEIVKQDGFMKNVEIKVLKSNLFNPQYIVLYEGNDYKDLDQVIIGDFLTLQRKNLLFWEVTNYETTYMPYYKSDEYSFEQAYEDYKEQILSGNVSQGLSPEEEKELNEKIRNEYPAEGELIDYISSPSGDVTIEVLAGKKQGSNYLIIGETGEDLKISNVTHATFSTDGKYFIYSTGRYNNMLGNIIPNADIWTSDLKGRNNKIFEAEGPLNDVNFISNGSIIIYGTKDQIGAIGIDGTNKKILKEFEHSESNSEELVLPEFIEITSNSVIYKLPDQSTILSLNF